MFCYFHRSCRLWQRLTPWVRLTFRYPSVMDSHEFLASTHMGLPQLRNYLLSNRKRLGLSQADVAYLLNAKSGEKICRHERFLRAPSLATALAYEAIYKRTVSELFSGLYRQIEHTVASRAALLAEKWNGCERNQKSIQKRRILAGLASMRTGTPKGTP